MTDYYLVTPESLAKALRKLGYPPIKRAQKDAAGSSAHYATDHEAHADAVLAAHPREATDALMAVMEDAHRFCSRVESRTGKRVDRALTSEAGHLRARVDAVLAALRKHIEGEGGS